MGLTLLWYPEWFCVSWQDLMHDSAELIQHLQALLLPHTGVVEPRESGLERQHEVTHRQQTESSRSKLMKKSGGFFSPQYLLNFYVYILVQRHSISAITVKLWSQPLSPLLPQWGWVSSLSPDTAVARSRRWPLPFRVFYCCPSRTCHTRRWEWWDLDWWSSIKDGVNPCEAEYITVFC